MRERVVQELGVKLLQIHRSGRAAVLLALATALDSCSTITPDLYPDDIARKKMPELDLVNHIQCQLGQAVVKVLKQEAQAKVTSWLPGWGAKVSLSLAVDVKDNLSPGLSFTHPLENAISVFHRNGNVTTPQNRSVGLGFTWSGDATRTETLGFFYSVHDLTSSGFDWSTCEAKGSYLSSDLKIAEFLEKGVSISHSMSAFPQKPGVSPYQTFTYEVKFIVTTSGSVTPAWKLVELSADQSSSLYMASRIHTDDLTITFGPVKTDKKTKATTPSPELEQQHLANLIGQAVANSLQGRHQQ